MVGNLTDDPHPRPELLLHDRLVWPVRRRFGAWRERAPSRTTFDDVLSARRSHRSLGRARLVDVLDVVRGATSVGAVYRGDDLARSRRTVASAGALHPVSVVIVRPGSTPVSFRVNPWSGGPEVLRVEDRTKMRSGLERVRRMLPEGAPTFLALIGDAGILEAAYDSSNSLLWRDAGALLATLHLLAVDRGLGFCPLGVLGAEFVEALFPDSPAVTPCGVAAIGTLPED